VKIAKAALAAVPVAVLVITGCGRSPAHITGSSNSLRAQAPVTASPGVEFGLTPAQIGAPSNPSLNSASAVTDASPSPRPKQSSASPTEPGPAPAEPAYPTGTCGQAGSQEAGGCIPVTDYGAQLYNLTGAQMAATWDKTQTEMDGPYTLNPVTADSYGNAVLYTNGKADNESQLDSSNGAETTGFTQTYGIFTAAIYMPSCSGKICSFPAFWLSSPDSRDAPPGDVNVWPAGGEFDIFEGLSGVARSHYHWGNGSPTAGGAAKSLTTPGWHILTGVWENGYVAAYFDGVSVFDYHSTTVEAGFPLEVVFDNASSSNGPASTEYLGWFEDYAWSGI